MRNFQLVLDRMAGLSFEELAKKHKCSHGSQARALYQNTLAFLVEQSPMIRFQIRTEANRILSGQS